MNKKYALVFMFFFAALLVPSVSAAVAASPGSTTTIMGMPVSQRITGLAADTVYVLDCETTASTEADQTGTSDAAGVLTFTVVPSVYGSNLYNLTITTAAGASQTTFTVSNMDIIPYLLPIIVIAILFGVLKSVSRMV